MRKTSGSLRVALALTVVTFFATSASGQSPASPPANADKETVAPEGSRSDSKENRAAAAAPTPKPNDLESQVADVKAENAALRESLRKMEEQQKALLEVVGRLQHKVDGAAAAEAQPAV